MPDSPLALVTLDTTVSALYSKADPNLSHEKIAHIYCGVTSAVDLTEDFSRNLKYIYQDASFNDAAFNPDDDEARRSLAVKMLSLVPQRDSFISGRTSCIYFHTGRSEQRRKHDLDQAFRTLDVLQESQQPQVVFCQGPHDLPASAQRHDISIVTSKVVVDVVAKATKDRHGSLRSLFNLDSLWYLNSKEALAKSGLPTPKSEVIELENFCTPGFDDLNADSALDDRRPSGWNEWIDEQLNTIVAAIRKRSLPFVVKGNQSFGGAGTYLITSEQSRDSLIQTFQSDGLLRKLFRHVSIFNERLNIGSLVFSELIENPRVNIGLTFFLNADGSSTFLGVSKQIIDRETTAWVGSSIVYSEQDAWRENLSPLMSQTAKFLHGFEYIGPVGADILETQSGERLIVDLNVRSTGSLCLPLMKWHFTSRGLQTASSMSITVKKNRDSYIQQWQQQFRDGSFVIVAWYDAANFSFGDIVVGAKDEAGLQEVIEKVRSQSEKVTF